MSDDLLSVEDMRLIRVEWRAEAEDRIKVAIAIIHRLESEAIDTHHLKELMRAFHSLKGTASMVGFRDVAEFVHQLEDYCEMFRGKQAAPLHLLSSSLLEKILVHLQGIIARTDADHDPYVGASNIPGELQAAKEHLAEARHSWVMEAAAPVRSPASIAWPAPANREEDPPPEICVSCPFIKNQNSSYLRPKLGAAELENKLTLLHKFNIEPCILIVDNETGLAQIVGNLIQVILPRARWVEADSGTKALNLLTSVMGDQIDLVMIDSELLDGNDFSVLRALHELKSRSEIFANSMIMTVQKRAGSDGKEALQLGVREFLIKPFGVEELLPCLIGPIREAMTSRLLVSIVSYSQRAYLALNRLQREVDPQLQTGIQREIHNLASLLARAQKNLQDAQMLPYA
ncbi:MAG TPA: Hpt domain-containing protein [Oligoflexus sp.]|uniref:Hpt domain-containing protein n=1 Tax=Oligoflexus sp. TaxID=1971216 RepID=UPI002D4DAD5B|nr:Hpt domain-containing protein [Oligoflexus sp.]HYX33484.1 Hpt domain-containing protein [Oligoflexus sp.]